MATSEKVLFDMVQAAEDQATLQKLVDQLILIMEPLEWPETEQVRVAEPRGTSRFWQWRYRKSGSLGSRQTSRTAWMVTPPLSEDDLFGLTEVGITTNGETVEPGVESFPLGGMLPSQRLGSPSTYGNPRRVQALIGLVQALLAKYDA